MLTNPVMHTAILAPENAGGDRSGEHRRPILTPGSDIFGCLLGLLLGSSVGDDAAGGPATCAGTCSKATRRLQGDYMGQPAASDGEVGLPVPPRWRIPAAGRGIRPAAQPGTAALSQMAEFATPASCEEEGQIATLTHQPGTDGPAIRRLLVAAQAEIPARVFGRWPTVIVRSQLLETTGAKATSASNHTSRDVHLGSSADAILSRLTSRTETGPSLSAAQTQGSDVRSKGLPTAGFMRVSLPRFEVEAARVEVIDADKASGRPVDAPVEYASAAGNHATLDVWPRSDLGITDAAVKVVGQAKDSAGSVNQGPEDITDSESPGFGDSQGRTGGGATDDHASGAYARPSQQRPVEALRVRPAGRTDRSRVSLGEVRAGALQARGSGPVAENVHGPASNPDGRPVQQSMISEMIERLTAARAKGTSEARFEIETQGGETIRVRIALNGRILTGRIGVGNEDTRAMVEGRLWELCQRLESEGFSPQNLGVFILGGGGGHGRNRQYRQGQARSVLEGRQEGGNEPTLVEIEARGFDRWA